MNEYELSTMSYQLSVFMLVNVVRIHPLKETQSLNAIAQNRADYLCLTGQFSHDDYNSFFASSNASYRGENLARGNACAVSTVAEWLTSPSHTANLLNPHYHFTGLGTACGITVQVFTS